MFISSVLCSSLILIDELIKNFFLATLVSTILFISLTVVGRLITPSKILDIFSNQKEEENLKN